MTDLTVLTVVENDKGLLDLMISSIYKFTNPTPKIIICDNGNNGRVLSKYANDKNIQIIRFKPTLASGSVRHGESLNKIFPLVTTKKTAIVESDCILLRSGWDNLDTTVHQMSAAKKAIVNGLNLYHICFLVFETEPLALGGFDFRPGTNGNRKNRSFSVEEDVGWRLANKIDHRLIKEIEFIDCKTGKGKFFDKTFQSDEFWVDGIPTVAHFGRGSNLAGKAIRNGFAHPTKQLEDWKKIAETILNA